MDDKLINHYINLLASKMNELNLENILLKAKLVVATEQLNSMKPSHLTEANLTNDNDNKAKKK
mgnify:CR=1 FL=1